MRTGIGYDIHPLEAGRPLVLGGVRIAFERGLAGHSDGDALAHAIIDALLGAAALGDIGHHFPPGDARFRNADSMELLRHTVKLIAAARYRIVNVDATVVAEPPKLPPPPAPPPASSTGSRTRSTMPTSPSSPGSSRTPAASSPASRSTRAPPSA